MKLKFYTILMLAGVAAPLFAEDKKPEPPKAPVKLLQTQTEPINLAPPNKEDISYAVGMMFGTSVKRAGFEVDTDIIAKSIKDVLTGKTRMTEKEANMMIQRAMMASQKVKGEKSKKEGEALLA